MHFAGKCSKFKKIICAEMKRRLTPLFLSETNRLATYLDPRYCCCWFQIQFAYLFRYRPLKKLMDFIDVEEIESNLTKTIGNVKSAYAFVDLLYLYFSGSKKATNKQRMGVLR